MFKRKMKTAPAPLPPVVPQPGDTVPWVSEKGQVSTCAIVGVDDTHVFIKDRFTGFNLDEEGITWAHGQVNGPAPSDTLLAMLTANALR